MSSIGIFSSQVEHIFQFLSLPSDTRTVLAPCDRRDRCGGKPKLQSYLIEIPVVNLCTVANVRVYGTLCLQCAFLRKHRRLISYTDYSHHDDDFHFHPRHPAVLHLGFETIRCADENCSKQRLLLKHFRPLH
jgi:hypothetical protein